MNNSTQVTWPTAIRVLHWLSALFIIGLFFLGLWMRSLDYYHPWYQDAPYLHKSFGLTLLLIFIVRLIFRKISRIPPDLSSHQPWEIKIAHMTHRLLYLGLILILTSGYLIASADNRPISVFEFFEIPVILTAFEQQEDWAGALHKWGAYILMAVVTLHILGALKHHFIDKDRTLKRML